MLDTAEKFEKAFERFEFYDGNVNSFLATDVCEDGSIAGSIQHEDWANVRNVTKFLEKFYEFTLKVSGSLYVTCNVYFEDICCHDPKRVVSGTHIYPPMWANKPI